MTYIAGRWKNTGTETGWDQASPKITCRHLVAGLQLVNVKCMVVIAARSDILRGVCAI
jgi:hypothetical protein